MSICRLEQASRFYGEGNTEVRALDGVSRHRIQKALVAGMVTIDGRARPKSFRPDAGAVIEATLPPELPREAEPEPIPLDIVRLFVIFLLRTVIALPIAVLVARYVVFA